MLPGNEVDLTVWILSHVKNLIWFFDSMGQIDPMGLRIVLNRYYQKYRLPSHNRKWSGAAISLLKMERYDSYRIDYLEGTSRHGTADRR